MIINQLGLQYPEIKESRLSGRYITNNDIEKCLLDLPESNRFVLGRSVEERPIYGVKLGNGPKKILLWSQMHGNESTTTKALFDLINWLKTNEVAVENLLQQINLFIIPILNPDGAQAYTRLNANSVDLNRDAQDLSQPESKILRQTYDEFKPDYCFNLHGQRTIFGAGTDGIVATLSFLSPAQDETRSLTHNRIKAMAVINSINSALQQFIPSGMGRYDDGFNINCVGDTFQSLGTPTLLYETGHYPNDYNREEVRRFAFLAIVKGLLTISQNVIIDNFEEYFKIPENKKNFRDVIIRNAKLSEDDSQLKSILIQFKETLVDDSIKFIPVVEGFKSNSKIMGHFEIDAQGKIVKTIEEKEIYEGYENDFVLINNKKTALKP